LKTLFCLGCPVKFKLGYSNQSFISETHVSLTVIKNGEVNHKGVCGNQIRGYKRVFLAEKGLQSPAYKMYRELAQKHKQEVIKHGNTTNIPTKGEIFF